MGRKAWITIGGMAGVAVLQLVATLRGQGSPDAAHGALAFMVGAFCGGNAAATFAVSRGASSSETVTVERTATTPKGDA